MVAGMRSAAVAAFVLAGFASTGCALTDETRVAVSNAIQSKAQIEFRRALMSTLR